MKIGDRLGFTEAGPGTAPDAWGEVVRADPDGSVALYFGQGAVFDYAPGVIQQGLANGSIVRKQT